MITKKHAKIIKFLSDKDGYTTSKELANLLNMSTKTIKRYIADLNDYLKKHDVEISSSRGIGYKIIGSKYDISNIVKEAENYIEGFLDDDSDESRISSVICLFINNKYISVDEVAEKLNLSIGATNKIICKVKECLKKYNLIIKAKPHYGSYIFGEEINLRQLITDYAIKNDSKNKIEVYLDNISEENIRILELVLEENLIKQEIIISDKDFNLLVSKIIVSIFRSKSGNSKNIKYLNPENKLHNYLFIKELMEELSEKIRFDLKEDEIIYISNYSGVVLNTYVINTNENILSEVEQKIKNLIIVALEDIFLISGEDYTQDKEFMDAIFYHLKSFINRSRANVALNNPLLYQIKSKFPLELNLAIFLSNKIESEFNIKLDEHELGYIAIHFAAANERRKKKTSKKICVICHYGIGTGQLLSEKLQQNINDLIVVGVYPARYLDIAINQDVDLIVSTVEIKNNNKPVLYIQNIFDDSVVENVNNAFYQKEERRKIINNMFDKRAFFKIDEQNSNKVILEICSNLQRKGLIDDDSILSILDREKVSSTEIGNLVAIPHTIIEGDKKSIIAVGILENPIIWDKKEVQLVFIVFFNPKEKQNFLIFRHLYNFIKDEGVVREIIKLCDFEKLITFIEN